MRRTTLAELDDAALTSAFNRVYEAYVIPMRLSAAAARRHVDINAIDLARSPLWLDDDGSVIGLSLLGVRGNRGWIGGFGVAPPYRGRGLSHALIAAALDDARASRLATVQLEVITTNHRAIQTYERAGFRHRRDLRIFSRPPDAPPTPANLNAEMRAAAARDIEVATLLAGAGQTARITPPWQREPDAFREAVDRRALALGPAQAPDGYLIYSLGDQQAGIADIAAATAPIAEALVRHFMGLAAGRRLSLSNEPAASPVGAVLESLGWTEVLRQHEMILTIDPAGTSTTS